MTSNKNKIIIPYVLIVLFSCTVSFQQLQVAFYEYFYLYLTLCSMVRCAVVQGTRSANEVVIMTVHDIGCDRKYFMLSL